jgi:hypothetical protein
MNVHESECYARKAAANITDPLSRVGLAEKHREAAALAEGTLAGLRDGCPDGHDISASVEAQLSSALFALRMAADRIQDGTVYTPAVAEEPVSDLVETTGPLYALTADQLAARDDRIRMATIAALRAEQNVLVLQ